MPSIDGEALLRSVPGVKKLARLRIVPFCNMDSTQMSPEVWADLSRSVDRELSDPEVTGAVVVHGTDTMAEGAYFLDLTLRSEKPVAVVGAMRTASDLSADGPLNIYHGVLQTVSAEGKAFGVTVTMNEHIHSAKYVLKTHTANVASFESGERGCLGYVTGTRVYQYHRGPNRLRLELPKKLAPVSFLRVYAGFDGGLIRYAADSGAEAIVLEGYGAGNINEAAYEAVLEVMARGVVVAVTSRVSSGPRGALYATPGGGFTLARAGAIVGGSLSGEKMRLLLMVALPQMECSQQSISEYIW